jgi:hypothetical protein
MVNDIIEYLFHNTSNGAFNGKSYYGEIFFAAALALLDREEYLKEIKTFMNTSFKKNYTKDGVKHWEFVNYAALIIMDKIPDIGVETNFIYGRAKSTNWRLLREVCYLKENKVNNCASVIKILERMQIENGLILDSKKVASFQYHCFSATLLFDIYEKTGNKLVKTYLEKAINFIENFTLSNGDTIMIGRGQEQIFGYGTLIYLYEIAYKITGKSKYMRLQNMVIGRLIESSGKIPSLVLNEKEKNSKRDHSINSKDHLGWYSYNNFFDYLPFLLLYLVRTICLHRKDIIYPVNGKRNCINYYDSYFLRFSNKNYDAILACFPGHPSNCQMLPYIISNKKNITPCYGGEMEQGCSLYPMSSLPLPYLEYEDIKMAGINDFHFFLKIVKKIFKKKKNENIYYLWENMRYRLKKYSDSKYIMIAKNRIVMHVRSVEFKKSSIEVQDDLSIFRKAGIDNIVVLNIPLYGYLCDKKDEISLPGGWKLKIEKRFEDSFEIVENGYCAMGKLCSINKSFTNINRNNYRYIYRYEKYGNGKE